MLYQTKEYFKFLLQSKNQHGIHSPFVFDLITKCFYKKTELASYNNFLRYKNKLLANKNFIKVTDFGAGSTVFKSDKRQISKIARIAGISNKKAKLLIRFVTYFQPKNSLEIGTSLGLGTASLYLGNPKSKIITLEGCAKTADIAQEAFNQFNFKNIHLFRGDFTNTLPIVNKDHTFDLVYFDGNHKKKATLNYFESCLEKIHPNTIFIFDDIHWSKEMTAAWQTIKKHPKVTVTIDNFFWGIVFFREEQAKEHFIIRV
jgi:predicted O-methyltransferase YrrM